MPEAPAVPGEENTPDSAKSKFLRELTALIESELEFPATARSRKEFGKVEVGFTLKKDGSFQDIKVVKGGEYRILNEAALRTVRKVARFKPVPDQVSKSDWKIIVPIQYRME